jgi:hypothetical protein
MTARTDPIAVVEAAYSREGSDYDWLRSVAELLHPEMDRGDGVVGYFYDTDRPPTEWVAEFVNTMHTSAPLYGDSLTVAHALGLSPVQLEAFQASFRPFGFEDTLALRTSDGTGRGLVLNPRSGSSASPRTGGARGRRVVGRRGTRARRDWLPSPRC